MCLCWSVSKMETLEISSTKSFNNSSLPVAFGDGQLAGPSRTAGWLTCARTQTPIKRPAHVCKKSTSQMHALVDFRHGASVDPGTKHFVDV